MKMRNTRTEVAMNGTETKKKAVSQTTMYDLCIH